MLQPSGLGSNRLLQGHGLIRNRENELLSNSCKITRDWVVAGVLCCVELCYVRLCLIDLVYVMCVVHALNMLVQLVR